MPAAADSAAPVAAEWRRLKGFGASALFVVIAVGIYLVAPYNQAQLSGLYGIVGWSVTGDRFLVGAAAAYLAALAVFYAWSPAGDTELPKSLRCLRVLAALLRAPRATWRQGLLPDDRVAVLSTLLKGFFAPMMAMSLMIFCMAAVANGHAIVESGAWADGFAALFNRYGFWITMQAILFVDVLLFTVGYLVESRRLGNQIRSVDPTLLGWTAALLCYPPFNQVTGMVLGSQVSDFPQFDDPTAHLVLNGLLLALMAVYASASVALGLKASNLTHRGIVRRGPYAVVRHPAYLCKNLAWWIGAAPLVSLAFSQSWLAGVQALASVIGWTGIYVLRALTEEDHLRSVDGEYAAYAARVRWRFIPGVV